MVGSGKTIGLKLIAAADEKMGIGKNNSLPWNLKKEFEYFTRMTTDTKDPKKQNAVVMGRRTWESNPEKDRPLAGRFNMVISNTIKDTGHKNVPVYPSLDECIKALSEKPLSDKIEDVWIIGGSSIYEESMRSPFCDRIYLTKVEGDFGCDTFYPPIPDGFKEIQEEGIPSEIQNENGISYRYTVLKRV